MSQALLLRGAKQLLTLRGAPNVRRGAQSEDLAIIQDGSILIRDGKIASVGPTRRLENMQEAHGALEVPVHGCIVMPGFVDAGIQLSLYHPPKNNEPPKRKKLADFYQESVTLMRSCLQHGTLTAGITAYSKHGVTNSELAVLRQLTRIGQNPVGIIRSWRFDSTDRGHLAPDVIEEALSTIRKHKLASTIELAGTSDELAHSALLFVTAAAQLQLRINWQGGDAGQLDRALHASSARSVFSVSALSPAECEVLADSRSIAIFKAGHGLLEEKPGGSLRDLADAGGAIALASGYDAEGEMNFNMQWVLALAVMRLRLSVEEAIVASTINAAYAMNCGHEVGSLEVDKRAEILVLTLDDYRELPRRLGVNHVGMVIRNGAIVMNRTRWRPGAA